MASENFCDDDSENITCNLEDYPPSIGACGLQGIIDGALGIGAQVVGIPYKVYRVGSTSNGDVIQPGNLIYSNFLADRRKYKTDNAKDTGLETLGKDDFIYSLLGDFSVCQVGDIFVQANPGHGENLTVYSTLQFNAFCLASKMCLKSRIGGRIDRQMRVYRPPATAGSNGYFSQRIQDCDRLVCINGQFVLQDVINHPSAVPSYIPCGIQSDRKMRGVIIENEPAMPPVTSIACYVMPLPGAGVNGFTFKAGDKLQDEDGTIYIVVNNYRQDSGFIGSQLVLDKMVDQTV